MISHYISNFRQSIKRFLIKLYKKNENSIPTLEVLLFSNNNSLSFFKQVFKVYAIFVLYIRSYFLVERPNFIYIITIVLLFMNHIGHDFISFFSLVYFWVFLGMQLIAYDFIGSVISQYLNTENGAWLSTSLLSLSKSSNIVKRHVGTSSWSAIFIGTTKMTATGRASLLAGAFTGTMWLYNGYLERKSANERSAADRVYKAEEAARQRAHQTEEAAKQRIYQSEQAAKQRAEQRAYDEYTKAHEKWENKRFNRGKEPQYQDYQGKY